MAVTETTVEAQLLRKCENKVYRDAFVSAAISCTIAGQLFSMRIARGWTQQQLADAAGMAQTRISAMEDPNYERYSVRTLKRLAAALDVGLSVRFVSMAEEIRIATSPDPLMCQEKSE